VQTSQVPIFIIIAEQSKYVLPVNKSPFFSEDSFM